MARTTMLSAVPAALALMLADAPARGHGDYDWIRLGKYIGVDGSYCCGVDDCHAIAPGRVRETGRGYELLDWNMTIPHRRTKRSEDGRFWLCTMEDRRSMRCFFAPPSGS